MRNHSIIVLTVLEENLPPRQGQLVEFKIHQEGAIKEDLKAQKKVT